MPHDVELPYVPMGFAAADASGVEGALAPVMVHGFTSSEDGDRFVQLLEGFPSQLLTLATPMVLPSTIDHLIAVIRPDRTARVYINECNVFLRMRANRSVSAGEVVREDDIVDIDSMVFEGVDFSADAGLLCVFSAGWRKGLFFDFLPLLPGGEPRAYDVSKALGSRMAYLRSQGVFHLEPADWDYLHSNQWFPFISLGPALRSKVAHMARRRGHLDNLVPEATASLLNSLDRMLGRWRAAPLMREHFELLERAVERFRAGDYVSCSAIVYPRIEGIMRSVHLAVGTGGKASQTRLTNVTVDARASEHHDSSLIVPEMFRQFLADVYFADFMPGQPSTMSRNSVGHGIAAATQFDQKAALIGLLTLDQVYYLLPLSPDDEPSPSSPPSAAA